MEIQQPAKKNWIINDNFWEGGSVAQRSAQRKSNTLQRFCAHFDQPVFAADGLVRMNFIRIYQQQMSGACLVTFAAANSGFSALENHGDRMLFVHVTWIVMSDARGMQQLEVIEMRQAPEFQLPVVHF